MIRIWRLHRMGWLDALPGDRILGPTLGLSQLICEHKNQIGT